MEMFKDTDNMSVGSPIEYIDSSDTSDQWTTLNNNAKGSIPKGQL